MRTLACAAATGLLLLSAGANAQSIGGRYDVEGTNFDGSPYSGTAEIKAASDSTCTIVWNTAGEISRGICMRHGNAFAAGYSLGKAIGLVVYQVMQDGTMRGVWTIAGQSGSGTEILKPK
ncbi:MAG: hypothetical protein KF914_02860 [Rhizobiaceae bacterium]|nr:hypothetical protein [Rhizobiaceae bacterium]